MFTSVRNNNDRLLQGKHQSFVHRSLWVPLSCFPNANSLCRGFDHPALYLVRFIMSSIHAEFTLNSRILIDHESRSAFNVPWDSSKRPISTRACNFATQVSILRMYRAIYLADEYLENAAITYWIADLRKLVFTARSPQLSNSKWLVTVMK